MTQSIILQIGQCGNQIGSRFWDLALKEHNTFKSNTFKDLSFSTFFHESLKNGNKVRKARAVLIDMEEGVVNEIMKSSIRSLFDHTKLITDVSGSGNNWATGYFEYGEKYYDQIAETIRKSVELCDSLQCFFILHSMGGGTGSGLGTRVAELVADVYPDVYRFVTAVFPSEDDDVITSPYNSLLAVNKLTQYADCVMPIENSSLIRIINNYNKCVQSNSHLSQRPSEQKSEKPFDSMNNIVANLMLNLTSSSRFEGTMNVDLNEISMNLVPFPRLHYLCSSQAPLFFNEKSRAVQPRRLDQIFADSFTKEFQMMDIDPRVHTYLACALLVRGNVEVSDIRRNIDRHRMHLKFVNWNREGWKVGHCSIPPSGYKYALLNLSNNTGVYKTFDNLIFRFNRLYKRKAHVHHYTTINGFDEKEQFVGSLENLQNLREDYYSLDSKNSFSKKESEQNASKQNYKIVNSKLSDDENFPRLKIAN